MSQTHFCDTVHLKNCTTMHYRVFLPVEHRPLNRFQSLQPCRPNTAHLTPQPPQKLPESFCKACLWYHVPNQEQFPLFMFDPPFIACFCVAFLYFVPLVTEKVVFCQKIYFDQRTACGAPVCWSKYTICICDPQKMCLVRNKLTKLYLMWSKNLVADVTA